MIPILLLSAAVAAFRIAVGASDDATLNALANFSPMAALALCAGAFFPKKWALAVPIFAQVLVDTGLHLVRPHPLNLSYSLVLLVAFVAVFAIGRAIRGDVRLRSLLGVSVFGSAIFYLITNTAAFFFDPAYAKSLDGWWQCLSVGVPGFPPTYTFFLKSLTGDLVFTLAIAAACGLGWRGRALASGVPVAA